MTLHVKNSKSLIKNLAPTILTFFSLLIFFYFAEISIRIFSKKERIVDESWWKSYVKLNRYNYRDTDHKTDKSPNIFRILVLGDSQTVGHGINNLENTWPKKLESLLNSSLPHKRFEIINSAHQGWNTDTQLYELFGNGFLFNPDLVLLGFYLNDTPTPINFNCRYHEKNFLKLIRQYIPFGKQSKFLNFLNFRFNRFQELLELKPTYLECLSQKYKSRSWEMEKVFLDTMIKGIRLKGSHFMATIIPVFSNLGEEYPLKHTHSKIENWFKSKKTIVLDLWKESFYGMEASKLIISEKDRHLNERAAKIIANTIYKKLEPLKKLKNLNLYQKAFNFGSLLSNSHWIKKLDQMFTNLEQFNQEKSYDLSYKPRKETLTVWKNRNQIYFKRSLFNKNSLNLKQTQKTELNINGDLIKNQYFWYSPNANTPTSWSSLSLKNNKKSFLKFGETNPLNKKIKKETLEFIFQTHIFEKALKLEVLKSVYFADPKSLEVAFSEKISPTSELTSSQIFNQIKQLIKLNPHLFFDFKNKGYSLKNKFGKLSRLEQILIHKEIEWTKCFFTLYQLGYGPYVESFIKDIMKDNPVPVLIRSIERYYFLNKKFKQLEQLYQSNSRITKRFKAKKTANKK